MSRAPRPLPDRARPALSALLLGALAGCAPMAPPYQAPALPVAAAYPASSAPSVSPAPPTQPAGAAAPGPDAAAAAAAEPGLSAAATGWRAHFTDPALQAWVGQALARNRDLRSAVLRVQEAQAAYGIERAAQLPSLGVQAGLDRSRVPGDLNLTGRPVLASQYQAGLGLAGWELDFWGRVRSLQGAALEGYLASDAARRAAAVALVAQVANGYLALCELDERLGLARRTIASRAESLRIFTRRVEVGATSRLALAQVQTLLTQAQALGAQLEQAREAQLQALALLAGGSPALAGAPGRLPDDAALGPDPAPGLPSDLLAWRPDIAAAEHRLRAAHASIGAARAAFFPRVALTGSLGTASAELDGLFAPGSRAWTFSPSVSLPLFDGGRLRSNLALAEVRRELAVADYEKTVQAAFRDVADALSARRWLAEQLAIARSALAAQAERARLSQLRYEQGAAAFLEVLDAQRDLLAAEQQLVQARRALLASRVSLYAALGGASAADLATHAP